MRKAASGYDMQGHRPDHLHAQLLRRASHIMAQHYHFHPMVYHMMQNCHAMAKVGSKDIQQLKILMCVVQGY